MCSGRQRIGAVWSRLNLTKIGAAFSIVFAAALLDNPACADDSDCKIEVQVVSTSVDGEAASPVASLPASHHQAKLIMPTEGDGHFKLASFCVMSDGKIVAVLDRQESGGHGGLMDAFSAVVGGGKKKVSDAKSDDKPSPAQVLILDADGKTLEHWPIDFMGQTVNVCPDGNLIIGGSGVLARYDIHGKQLARSDSPHIVASRKDPEQLKQQARDLVEQQRNSIKETLKNFEAQREVLLKKDDKSLSDEERQMKQQIDQLIATYKQASSNQVDKPITDQDVDIMVTSLTEQASRINAVAASDKYLFCTAPASKGYGYSVWRTDLDFSNPKRIVDGLSGCCGQMDIQCCGDEIVVAENSRKRVVRYNSDGKEVGSWGKAGRDGERETFGSCCNPMNTRPVGDKLYVSDSDGRVRLFTRDGKYESEVGKANVTAGCKSSIVDASPDGNRVYYIDVNNSRICVLDRTPATEHVAQ